MPLLDVAGRVSGGPVFSVAPSDFRIDDDTAVSVYRSSGLGERAFCSRCGTGLFYRVVETGEVYLNVFTLDDPGALAFDHEIFIDDKPDFYAFGGDRPRMTGAEVFAAVMAAQQQSGKDGDA